MAFESMSPELMQCVADRFKALAEPARLTLLHALRGGERTVSELVESTGMGQANVSKHLRVLHGHGFVTRRKEGLFSCYQLADQDVLRLCDIVCGRLEKDVAAQQRMLGTR
jgi:DNA-binding transcriptional ArsR family regulator